MLPPRSKDLEFPKCWNPEYWKSTLFLSRACEDEDFIFCVALITLANGESDFRVNVSRSCDWCTAQPFVSVSALHGTIYAHVVPGANAQEE
jgi:hypothetical protein